MQKHINLVDLVKSFPTNIYLQNLASIQPRTSPVKFARSSGAAAPLDRAGGGARQVRDLAIRKLPKILIL